MLPATIVGSLIVISPPSAPLITTSLMLLCPSELGWTVTALTRPVTVCIFDGFLCRGDRRRRRRRFLRFRSLRRIVLCSGHPRGLSAPSRKKVQTVGTHFIMTYTNPHQIRVRVHYKFQYKTSLIFTASHTSH